MQNRLYTTKIRIVKFKKKLSRNHKIFSTVIEGVEKYQKEVKENKG